MVRSSIGSRARWRIAHAAGGDGAAGWRRRGRCRSSATKDGDAKKKKKKKKCKAPKVKCGKQCLPAGSCCADADCGA